MFSFSTLAEELLFLQPIYLIMFCFCFLYVSSEWLMINIFKGLVRKNAWLYLNYFPFKVIYFSEPH